MQHQSVLKRKKARLTTGKACDAIVVSEISFEESAPSIGAASSHCDEALIDLGEVSVFWDLGTMDGLDSFGSWESGDGHTSSHMSISFNTSRASQSSAFSSKNILTDLKSRR